MSLIKRTIKLENGLVLELYHDLTTHDRTAAVVAHTGYKRNINIPEMVEGHRVTTIRSGVFPTGHEWKLHIPATVTEIESLPTGYSESRQVPTTHFLKEMGPDFDTPGFIPTMHTVTKEYNVLIHVIQNSYAHHYCRENKLRYYAAVSTDKSSAGLPYEYEIDRSGTSISIKKYVGKEAVVTIPSYLDGLMVDGVSSNAFSNCSTVREIIISDGIQSLGAISNCENLERVYIPESVYAFISNPVCNCPKLEVVVKKGSFAESTYKKYNVPISYHTTQE